MENQKENKENITEVVLGENQVLKLNETVIADMKQFIDDYGNYSSQAHLERINQTIINDPKAKEIYMSQHLPVGKKIWLELEITDSLHAGLLYSWMFRKSTSGDSGMNLFGAKIQTMFYQKLSILTDEEKHVLNTLVNKINNG